MSDIEKNGTAHGHGGEHGDQRQRPQIGPGATSQHLYTLGANPLQQAIFQEGVPNLRKLANPAPLGLFSFASTTLILSLVNVQTRGVRAPNIVVGMALFVGGLAQFMAGMWEFAAGNTFGATAFSSYGGFWLAYATIFIPGSGILEAYANSAGEHDQDNAVAFFLTAWFIFTLLMFIGSLRSNAGLISLFFCLTITFMLLMIADFTRNVSITKAGGWFGIATAFIAYYCAAANLITRDSSFLSLPLVPIPKRGD